MQAMNNSIAGRERQNSGIRKSTDGYAVRLRGWGEEHHHAATLKTRVRFDDSLFRQLLRHPFHQIEGNVAVDDLTSTEANAHPHFGAVIQELSRLGENDLNIMFACFGAQTHFLDLDLLLGLARFRSRFCFS